MLLKGNGSIREREKSVSMKDVVVDNCPFVSTAVRLHDSISEEGHHYLIFDL